MIKVGDKVGYSHDWLRSTGNHTGPIPFARGVVIELAELSPGCTLARVDWNDPDIPARVHVGNLARVGSAKWAG